MTELETHAFVGRSRELAAATGFVNGASGPVAVVLHGEPGIGKTSLLRSTLDSVDATVLLSRSSHAEASMSLVGLADLLAAVPDEAMAGLPAPQRRALDAVLLRTAPEDEHPASREVAVAVGSVLEALAARGPVAIGIDDVQWLDPSSEAALRFVIRRLRGLRIAVLMTVRSGAAAANPLGVEDAIPDAVARIEVGPLSIGSIHDLVANSLGVSLSRPVLVRISDVSGGNPFYALELCRALVADGRVDDPAAIPRLSDRLHRLVDDRILALTPSARTMTTVAAAAGHADVSVLTDALDADDWSDAGGAEAEDAGVLEVDRGQVRFTHPLLAAAVLDNTAPSDRRSAHRRLAAAVDDPESTARHLAAAATGPDEAVATALDSAARHAWARGARLAAAEMSDMAVDASPLTPRRARHRRRLDAAGFAFEAANPARANAHLRAVLDETTDPRHEIEAHLQLGSAQYEFDGYEPAVAHLRAALDMVDDGDHRVRARISVELAYVQLFGGDRAEALSHATRAVEDAARSGDPMLECSSSAVAALAHLFNGDGLRDDLVDAALGDDDSLDPLRFKGRITACAALKWADHFDRARDLLTEQLEFSSGRDDQVAAPIIEWLLTDLEILVGNWDEAERLATRAVDATRFRTGDFAVSLSHAARARVLTLQGRHDEARFDIDVAMEAGARIGGVALVYAVGSAVLLQSCRGDSAAVHDLAGPMVALARAMEPTDPAFLRWVPDEIDALIALGEIDEAADVLGWFESLCDTTGRQSAIAGALRCRAQLVALGGDDEQALTLAERAADTAAAVGLPHDEARALLVAGGIQRRLRRKQRADEALGRAEKMFDALGAPDWTERAAAERRRVGMRSGAATDLPGALTVAEAQVAEIVATGMTTKEAAAELFMSPKTVEHHLTRIYAKLGIRSRRELAAALGTIAVRSTQRKARRPT